MVVFEWKIKKRPCEDDQMTVVRVTHHARSLKWQFRDRDGKWHYDVEPTVEFWQQLHQRAKARYYRRKLDFKVLQLIESGLCLAMREQEVFRQRIDTQSGPTA